MFIQATLEVINAFLNRYVPYVNEQGDYTDIKTVEGKVRFTFNNDYYIFAWIENEELHIESEYGENIFDYADCYDWSEEDVHYIKYGK
jgi:hypothetical protein